MKKTILLFVTLLSITITNAQLTAGATFDDGLYNYIVTTDADPGSPNTVSLTGVNAGGTLTANVTIPASVNEGGFDYAITLISGAAFKGLTVIETLVIQGDTEPGFQSFMDCSNLTSIDLPVSSGAIGAQAFRNCTALATTSIPNITSIGVQSFRNCTSLITISLPSVTSIGASVAAGLSFWQSTNLTTVDMPVVENIYVGAFNSTGLTSVTLPASLTVLDETNWNIFKFCSSLTQVTIEFTTPIALTYNGASGSFVGTIFEGIDTNATLTVPNGSLGDYTGADVWQEFSTINEATALSTHSQETELGWSFYPNPAKDVVSITNSQSKNAAITIYDFNGRSILSKNISKVESEINISNLQSGIYLFKVSTDTGSFVKRIIKN
ncbi:MAG: leucine-rich repeat domain-containing protein [Algibacter sp.]|uniref:leucine-rich repeat domain-containing protein n=1 Tax=Algibacter sp. TaxID=1872428 RepID=UPI003297F09A